MNEKVSFLKKVKDKSFWEKVRNNPKYSYFIEELTENYKQHCEGPIAELPYHKFRMFGVNGNRTEYEQVYFSRRQRLNTLALFCMIYPENEDYFAVLQDVVWAICSEYSWALPAHIGIDLDENNVNIYDEEKNPLTVDLFASETAFALSEIKYILGDRFDEHINKLIHSEIKRRIIEPFENRIYFWENFPENWAAVCAGSIGAAILYEFPELFPEFKGRIMHSMETFLSSYKSEGFCEEGVAYWEYGFGFFVAFASLLYDMTDGAENLFEREHVKNIAKYSNYIFLGDSLPVTFGDSSDAKNPVSFALMEYLRRMYGDEIPTLDFDNYGSSEYCARWQRHIRSIVFFDPEHEYIKSSKAETIFRPLTGIFMHKQQKYDLAVTAGYNDAPHNHNDLGSFILRYNDKRIFDDLGAGEYTKDYFDADKRYLNLVCGAHGHSVPQFGDCVQPYGKQYSAKTQYDDKLIIDLTMGYDCPELKKIIRTFECKDDCVVLTDSFEYSGIVTERFVTKTRPELKGGKLYIGDARIDADMNKWEYSLKCDSYKRHGVTDGINVYIIEFTQKDIGDNKFEMLIQLP